MSAETSIIGIKPPKVSDFHKVCRFCLCETDLNPIQCFVIQDTMLPVLFTTFLNLKFDPLDCFPKNVCANCAKAFHMIHMFRKQCLKIDDVLHFVLELDEREKSQLQTDPLLIERQIIEKDSVVEISDEEDEAQDNARNNIIETGDSQTKHINNVAKLIEEAELMFVDPPPERGQIENVAETDQLKNVAETIANENDDDEIGGSQFDDEIGGSQFDDEIGGAQFDDEIEDEIILTDISSSSSHDELQDETGIELIKLKQSRAKKRVSKPVKRPYSCTRRCARRFATLEELKNHQLVSKCDKRLVKCPYCEKEVTSASLHRHLALHSEGPALKCDDCPKTFRLPSAYKLHRMIHTGERSYYCNPCGKGFFREHFYKIHMHAKHQSELENKGIKLERKQVFMCEVCGKTLTSLSSLTRHKFSHQDKHFVCSECNKPFASAVQLRSHFRVHTGERPYKCFVCDKTFARTHTLDSHMLTHSGIRPYKCNWCPRSFLQKTQVMYHARTHTGERPFDCSYCDKKFALKNTLRVHMRCHTGEKPFACPICHKRFAHHNTFKSHRRRHLLDVKQNGDEIALNTVDSIVTKDGNVKDEYSQFIEIIFEDEDPHAVEL